MKDPLSYFELKPLRAARVSEISETTASSAVAAGERVNFHIGNPVQDPRLSSAYLRIVLGIDIDRTDLGENDAEQILNHLGWEIGEKSKLEFLRQTIQRSSPYTPRGGFSRTNPPAIVRKFAEWLQNQPEPMQYDFGETSGKREVILASGGVREALRVLFHALSSSMSTLPARVFFHACAPGLRASDFNGLSFENLPDDGHGALAAIRARVADSPEVPTFLVLGSLLDEETRRSLRHISIEHPLFFIEVNDAPNRLSLAREAKLVQNVLRFLTPAIFDPKFRHLSTVFLAGNSDYLKVFEAIHFQFKGTPSASEIELLSFVLDQQKDLCDPESPEGTIASEPTFEGLSPALAASGVVGDIALSLENRLGEVVGAVADKLEQRAGMVTGKIESMTTRMESLRPLGTVDRFARTETSEFLDDLLRHVDSAEWHNELQKSLLSVFLKHHPEYRLTRTVVASGSSRTALGLLGFHCGIREVVASDLSWSYEHCFPSVHAVPLTENLELDPDALIDAVRRKIIADPGWRKSGALVINNPHNATGRVFDEARVRRLVTELLGMGVLIIDDLSYQYVAPSADLPRFKTVRQIANELVRNGILSEEQSENVVTVHSVSKTDCLAGARLAFVEVRRSDLFDNFAAWNGRILPNLGAIALTYLFYRSDAGNALAYWKLRNQIFLERTNALLETVAHLPPDRNLFHIEIVPPTGSMYPLLVIHQLPAGLSLDWLASGLARQGIGMLPLSTFARTEKGFDTGRMTFRLTLGGVDGAEALLNKTRRVLIDLNRLIAEESARYNRIQLPAHPGQTLPVGPTARPSGRRADQRSAAEARWTVVEQAILAATRRLDVDRVRGFRNEDWGNTFAGTYVPERLAVFRQRWIDRSSVAEELLDLAKADGGKSLVARLEREFYKDSLARRVEAFHNRSYDRTVHPTQMYSMNLERRFNKLITAMLRGGDVYPATVNALSTALLGEFLGLSVAITSSEEPDELTIELDSRIAAENFASIQTGADERSLVSFWSDWDGSNRPSGQGHRLAAGTVMANVNRLARLVTLLVGADAKTKVDPQLLAGIRKIPENNRRFAHLLNDITTLTQQLERRYRGILPFTIRPGTVRSVGMKLHLARDPLTLLWHHNDRLERKMLILRQRRRETLEYYFALNKQLRKQLHALLAVLPQHIGNRPLMLELCLYRDLLQRMAITPRIDQKMITAQDSFAIDTTVHNIHELNEIAALYGNPGIVLALQVSMTTKAEALIALNRKMRARREQSLRLKADLDLPTIDLIPLFEDLDAVKSIPAYLNKIWDYALQSRRMDQETQDRFAEILSEVFIAGSDLSQQVGQAAGASLYGQAKYELTLWLAEHRVAERVRVKLGSGEPMQRQGGYYADVSGLPAFGKTPGARQIIETNLRAAGRKSAQYATTPLMGIFTEHDLRTLQSAVSERLRQLPVQDAANALYHLKESQHRHRADLIRATESLVESRLQQKKRGTQEIERLTVGVRDAVFDQFIGLVTENFRQILYGREEDVVGIHVISYFIARTMPQLRDRPTVRPTAGTGQERGQKILEQIAGIIPFSRHGSRLRAIAHNQAQTAILGLNQLTTGVFRSLERFAQLEFKEGDAESLIADRLFPRLPVYEMLHNIRIYHDPALTYVKAMEEAFPAGNTALLALREDNDSLKKYIGLMQQELIRRHGLEVGDFFEHGRLIPGLLPALRPDLAVLLQEDLFNTDLSKLVSQKDEMHPEPVEGWTNEVRRLLSIPDAIRAWRTRIWSLLEQPIFQRVQSFVELAVALHSLSANGQPGAMREIPGGLKVPTELSHFFRGAPGGDDMRDFLAAAFDYLTSLSAGMVEVPVAIIRSLQEVERIARIEEQALPPEKQELLRFYMLQIARLAGENG
ncbi:MAG TPA: pyridoxal phosphate-dependent aminotransferase [Bacteroidota bacterium]|nr:pyridoxal phosphate-dependent aminotransferase [Bacteroidota bacterium]